MGGLDLSISRGERVLLLGASGAGKSTLLQALAGVLGGEDEGDSTGELLVDGTRPDRSRGRVGLVLQDPDSQVILARVCDDVAFGCENLGVPREEIWRRVRESLDAVGLDLPLEFPTALLSGGQKQRLALAGVLAMRPGLLLLDEPTANLDPSGVGEVRDAVGRVIEDRDSTFIVIEHRVETWIDLVDRVIVLEAGAGIVADGSPREVLAGEGKRLAASGVWVPRYPPSVPARTSTPGSMLLQIHELAIARPGGQVIQDHLDVRIAAGTALAVTGPNGSGKSTLGLTLGGLIPPASGTVDASGLAKGLGSDPLRWKSRELVSRIGSVFQDPEHQFLAATVRDELAVGPRVLKLAGSEIDARVDELAQRLRLTELLAVNPFTLSGGEKRRLSVATALITRPPLLIMDEPTFGQDSRTWSELVALFAELLDAGDALVAITHDAAFVDAIADSELTLSAGAEAVRR
ncbi:MAG: energy-coupling factor transport system ATP-binding protein [Actinomycetota bacterium]|nr:energy-coupling factor transport system ATP-binding protein [Actinomycetota bacterium]